MAFATASAFVTRSTNSQVTRRFSEKITITEGVEFDTIAREWRLKWSPDNEKKSLASVQQSLQVFLPAIQKIDGVKSVQRLQHIIYYTYIRQLANGNEGTEPNCTQFDLFVLFKTWDI